MATGWHQPLIVEWLEAQSCRQSKNFKFRFNKHYALEGKRWTRRTLRYLAILASYRPPYTTFFLGCGWFIKVVGPLPISYCCNLFYLTRNLWRKLNRVSSKILSGSLRLRPIHLQSKLSLTEGPALTAPPPPPKKKVVAAEREFDFPCWHPWSGRICHINLWMKSLHPITT